MIEKISFEDFISEFKNENKKISNIGKKLGLHYKNGEVIELNFNRGPLLYYLISKFKPKNILEFGTGGGYGTMCMAYAMTECKIDGTIFTIDILDNTKSWIRAVDWQDKRGVVIEEISNKEMWSKNFPTEWQEKIKTISGYSAEVMKKKSFPKIDFAYIDGAHFYEGVKHDFISFLKNSNKEFVVLFDDYIDIPSYGVKKFIDEEISKWFDIKLIETDPKHYLFNTNVTTNKEYGMCLIESNTLKNDKKIIINNNEKFLKSYQLYEKRLIVREKINKIFPFMKNKKLSWWK